MIPLYTKWGRELNEDRVLTEHPRPQMKRKSYVNLNGRWRYGISAVNHTDPSAVRYEGEILVPFSPESSLSGMERQLRPGEYLWYERTVAVPADYGSDKRLLLHFGAVDQMCKIYVNQKPAGRHMGGYLPFTVDLTDYVNHEMSDFLLSVCVKDLSDTSYHSRGKQCLKRGGMFYTAQSGIWQSVWMECAPRCYVIRYTITPDAETGRVEMRVHFNGKEEKHRQNQALSVQVREAYLDELSTPAVSAEDCRSAEAYTAECFRDRDYDSLSGDALLSELRTGSDGHVALLSFTVKNRRLWSPETPYLYYFKLKAGADTVLGYFAFRSFSVERQAFTEDFSGGTFRTLVREAKKGDLFEMLYEEVKSHPRICLNHKPFFQKGVLDQGYWPEGLYTAPHDLAFIYDILKMKELGFNMLRKHLKIEPDRFYYHCDRIGMTVWQDMVNGGGKYKFWFVTYMATAFNQFRYRIFDNCYYLLSRTEKAGRREFEREMVETAELLYNHPCISTWVIFNEGWGQFDAKRLAKRLKEADPTRLIDAASGWFDQSCGDVRSQHYYYMKLNIQWCLHRATVLSEFGGISCRIKGHTATGRTYGYSFARDPKEFKKRYKRLMDSIIEPEIQKGLSATVYTQLSDVEDEVNGILTYDREICKLDA
ncbi:MAG: glycoside hydrolase family 2 [Lachnospiraceae bacterium]|nr:glycoside hydrolase family 2 [Lachnospiraceae bacterium]